MPAKNYAGMYRRDALKTAREIIDSLLQGDTGGSKKTVRRTKQGKHHRSERVKGLQGQQAIQAKPETAEDVEVYVCRVCHEEDGPDKLLKYGKRHWGHPECLLKWFGANAFMKLSVKDRQFFPDALAEQYGVKGALMDARSKP